MIKYLETEFESLSSFYKFKSASNAFILKLSASFIILGIFVDLFLRVRGVFAVFFFLLFAKIDVVLYLYSEIKNEKIEKYISYCKYYLICIFVIEELYIIFSFRFGVGIYSSLNILEMGLCFLMLYRLRKKKINTLL